jgi:hypothetical protein
MTKWWKCKYLGGSRDEGYRYKLTGVPLTADDFPANGASGQTMNTRFAFLASILVCFVAAGEAQPLTGRIWHVATNGFADAAGTPEHPLALPAALSATGPAKPGDAVLLQPGVYESETKSTERIPFTITLAGEKERPIRIQGASPIGVHLNGTLEINGSFLQVMNLEIGNADYVRTNNYPHPVEFSRSRDVEFINCNVFGASSTLHLPLTSRDIRVYGCLVHDSCGLPHGAGNSYLQNMTNSTKTIEQCVAYRSSAYNLGVHVYSADAAHNVRFIENIAFLGGCVVTQRNFDNIFVNPGVPLNGVEVIGNVAYQHETACNWRPNVRLSSKKEAKKTDYTNVRGVVRDNWIMGGLYAVSMGRWKHMTFENNTVWAENLMIEINSATMADAIPTQEQKPDLSGYRLASNHYFTTPEAASFRYDRTAKIEQGDPLLTFAKWQALGLDTNSVLEKTSNGRPTGTMVRVFPNRYEKGRANVAIFNWDGRDTVNVNLSKVLTKGDRYRVYNCLEVTHTLAAAKPVLTATYDGGEVTFPMKKDPSSPDFDAFLVLLEPAAYLKISTVNTESP